MSTRSTTRCESARRVTAASRVIPLAVTAAFGAVGCPDPDPGPPPPPPPPVGCFTGHPDEAVVEDRAYIVLRGLAPPGTERVEIQMKDLSTDAYTRLGPAQLNGASSESCAGETQSIAWNAGVTLPTERRYYAGLGQYNAIELRAAGFDATGNVTGPEITLKVRCGPTLGLCCAPWDTASARSLSYGEPCTGANDVQCDRCDDPGALCDWDFTCKSALWPPDASEYSSNVWYPERWIQEDWTWNVQGVATDGVYWYLTQAEGYQVPRGALYKVPVDANLDQNFYPASTSPSASAPFPYLQDMPKPYCRHWGDPEIHEGRVYVPMEECGGDGRNRIMEVDAATLAPLGTAPLEGLSAPSVAVHPSTGEFFVTGPYDANTNAKTLRVFRAQPSSNDAPFTLTADRDVAVFDTDGVTPLALNTVQGLAFSPSGKLYVAAQGTDQNVYCFQVSPDKVTLMYKVYEGIDQTRPQEYEGMAALDMGSDFGQVHLFVYQNGDAGHEHGAWFKHIKLNSIATHADWY